MNLHTHHSLQISGQVSNQAGTMLPGLPQQHGNPVPSQMQNPSIHHNAPNMDPEIVKTRRYMQQKIWDFLMQRRPQSYEVPNKKMIDMVKRMEDCLFKTATTKEEYLNLETLERRIHVLIKGAPMTNQNQHLSHANSSPSVGIMIPTPGFQQPGNSSLIGTSSLDSSLVANNSTNTIASSTVNSGSFFPTRNGSSGSMHGCSLSSLDGTLAGGYQQSSNTFLVNTGGNNMDPEIVKTRRYMQQKIWDFLMQRRPPSHEVPNTIMVDIVKRMEDGLFKTATTKEEYLNLETLEQRLHVLIKHRPMSNQNQQLLHSNSSPVGTMIRDFNNLGIEANSSPSVGTMIRDFNNLGFKLDWDDFIG